MSSRGTRRRTRALDRIETVTDCHIAGAETDPSELPANEHSRMNGSQETVSGSEEPNVDMAIVVPID